MPKSAAASARTFLVDAGVFVAAIDRGDEHHAWALEILPKLKGRFMTCEACATEALHLLESAPAGISALRTFLNRMTVAPVFGGDIDALFGQLERFAPRMDLADGCLCVLAKQDAGRLILTTDTRDFSTYRIPFLSPMGLFADF